MDENLIDVWKNDKLNRFPGQTAKYVTSREELMNVNTSKVDHLLGKTVKTCNNSSSIKGV